MKTELTEHGFENLVVWGRGVDGVIFNSSQRVTTTNGKKKLLYVGRVSIEKNLEEFFKLNTEQYELYVVGDGPMYEEYNRKFPHVNFLGAKKGFELAWWFANCDVFVFPSLTDTFGIVMIEASRCGTPIAAFPVTGPIDYVKEGVTGSLDWDLDIAVQNCLKISRVKCEEAASKFTWKNVAITFRDNLISA
jgi:glycosyltransferase involved in cell wall biosynthesis